MTPAWEHGVEVKRAMGRRDVRRLPARVGDDTTGHLLIARVAGRPSGRLPVRVIGKLTVAPGDVERSGRDIGAVKTRGLLELLLIARGASVSKDELVHALWDGKRNMPADPVRTLEHYVCVLRSVLTTPEVSGHDIVVTGSNSYVLDPAHLDLDLDQFEHAMRHAAALHGEHRRTLLEAAVGAAGADLFDDSPNRTWAQSLRTAHRENVAWAHQLLADDAVERNDLHRAVWHGEQVLRFTPYAEHAFRVLMVAHLGLGSRELARLTHRRCVNLLWRDLRLDPTAHTAAVAAAIDAGSDLDELVRLLAPANAA